MLAPSAIAMSYYLVDWSDDTCRDAFHSPNPMIDVKPCRLKSSHFACAIRKKLCYQLHAIMPNPPSHLAHKELVNEVIYDLSPRRRRAS